ncbi:MAG TPA: TolC family protein [Pirellulales bacterium]|nr:TolC family protein [Pirellulales bacterium]
MPREQLRPPNTDAFLGNRGILPINLPTALRVANVSAIDVRVASEKTQVAAAQLLQARTLWLPTILSGTDYYRHDGQIQDIQGNVANANHGSFLLGTGPYMVFALSDALFAPVAARQVVGAQRAVQRAAQNDIMLAVAESYFQAQQARGALAGAEDTVDKAADLLQRVEALGEVLVPPFEKIRVGAELRRRRQTVYQAYERLGLARAELTRLLRLDPTTVLDPLEPPELQITLIDSRTIVDELIRVGLTRRPELAANQAFVQATLARLRQERIRPLVPSVLLRGASSGVFGTLAGGYFGGGTNGNMNNFGPRADFDLQVLWELQNMGFGNRARVREKEAENRQAALELLRTQDRIAAEVAQAHLQVQTSLARLHEAEWGLKDALDSVAQNMSGLKNTKQVGNLPTLVTRPQEVVAAMQALGQAYDDYYGAVADHNRAQFRLYRALGNPATAVEKLLPPEAQRDGAEQVPTPRAEPTSRRYPHVERNSFR